MFQTQQIASALLAGKKKLLSLRLTHYPRRNNAPRSTYLAK